MGGVRLPAGCSGSVGGGTERGVRVAAGRPVGTPGRVAVSSRYPPGRVIGPSAHYPADRVTGTACYPCGRVTGGIGVTLRTRQPGNHVGWCYPARAAPHPQCLPVAGSPPLQVQHTTPSQLLAIPMQRPHHPTRNPRPKLPCPGPWAPPRFGIPTGRPHGDSRRTARRPAPLTATPGSTLPAPEPRGATFTS